MKKLILTLFFITAISQAQIVNIPDANFKNMLVNGMCIDTNSDGTYDNDADTNNDGEIQLSEAASVVSLKISGTSINDITAIESFSNLQILKITQTGISVISLSGLGHILIIRAENNLNLTSVYLSDLIADNIEIRIMGNAALANVTVLDSNTDNVTIIGNAVLQSLNIHGCDQLEYLYFNGYNLTDFNISEAQNITFMDIDYNHLESLDLSGFSNLTTLTVSSTPYLRYINLKNGRDNTQSINLNVNPFAMPDLRYICTDDVETAAAQLKVDSYNIGSVQFNQVPVINTYCSFTLAGNYNTLAGNVLFDADSNGCDSNDPVQPYVTLNVSDGTDNYYTLTSPDGGFNYFGQTGSFNVSVAMENASLFTITPPLATIIFGNNNNNITTQDFCITANGIQNDLETVIVPLQPARPGFDATYKIIYKNKGNQVLSGSVDFTYQENELDFINGSIIPDAQSSGALSWDFSNLYPFESRSIEVRLNVNSPMETPAVNIGDQLNFSVQANPLSGDVTPADNVFSIKQIVVGSFDPNDITCLEGEHVNPTEIGNYLHYNINFENTGTAAAENIVVKNMIDLSKYDISSLQILNASHTMTPRITNSKVEFIFEGINLGASEHGNVTFKIRTKNTLVTGNSVSQKADIYFDYNFPVATNVAVTTFDTLGTNIISDNDISIYPNPTNGLVNVKTNSEIKSVELFDVQGRQLLAKNNVETLDISGYNSGVYFIKVNSDKGVKTQKLIKQ